jgi:hypothetical protein
MITREGENLVFILSLPRSGSTLLSIIMGAHSQIYCPPEPWFLLRLAEVYGEPTSERIFDDYYASLATKAFMNEESFLKSARAFALQTYNDILEKEKRTIFVDKTPRYYHILDFIDQLFPKAKKIWLKRNPLDVAASYKRSWNIGIDVLTGRESAPAAFDFIEGLYRFVEYFDNESPYKFEIGYENIVTSPKKTIEDLCRFCEIPFEHEMLQLAKNKEQFRKSVVGDKSVLEKEVLDAGSVHCWRSGLTEKEVASLFGTIASHVFERMGYESTTGNNAGPAQNSGSRRNREEMAFRRDLYRRARFGEIYRELQECRRDKKGLEEYVSELKTEFQHELENTISKARKELEEKTYILNGYLKSILASRYLNLGWKMGLAKKPAWVDRYLQKEGGSHKK